MIYVRLVPLPQNPSFERERWAQAPERTKLTIAAAPAVGTHLLVGEQDWLVERVTMRENEQTIVVHVHFNGIAEKPGKWCP